MSSQLLMETAAAAVTVAAGVKALAAVLRTWIEQTSRTRRLTKALEDSSPSQRPGIIRACSQLEGKPDGSAGGGPAAGVLPAQRRSRQSMLILQNKRGHERRGD